MGFLKKIFNDVGDAIKNNVEERKQEIRQNIEERKQQFYESIEERKKEVLSKLGVKSEETDQKSASIYDVVTTSDDNNRKIDGGIAKETAKNKQEQEHEEKKEPTADSATLESIIQQIKEQIQSLGLSSFTLYANDYEGDREYEEVEQLGDEGLLESSSEYAINYNDSYDGNSSVYTKVRKIEIQESGVTFDIEEIYEDNDGDEESRGFHEAQTIDRILESCNRDTVKRGLGNILTYLNDETLIKLNKNTENESMPEPVLEPKPEPEADVKLEVEQKEEPIENGGLFSARLEAMIAAALQDGVLTDKEREILKRRVEKEGEDWDEVEMIIEARLAEKNPVTVQAAAEKAAAEKAAAEKAAAEKAAAEKAAAEKAAAEMQALQIAQMKQQAKAKEFDENGVWTVPETVYILSKEKVKNKKNLKKVILPKSLKEIGDDAFRGCSNLQILDFSKCTELWDINYGIIYEKGLDSLKKIILPPSQTEFNALCVWGPNVHIGEETNQAEVDLSHCNFKVVYEKAFQTMDMKEIIIPDTVETIGENAFDECKNLKTIVMPAALKEIKAPLGHMLEQLKKVDFSKVTQLKVIPKKLFEFGCNKLKELMIPNGVTEIEDDAFHDLWYLKKLFLPPSLTTMGDFDRDSDTPSYKMTVYCYSPHLEELVPLVYGWDDEEDDDDYEDMDEEDMRELGLEPGKNNKIKTTLYVLPQYVDAYTAQRDAECIPNDVLTVLPIPDEYLYYYDN